MVRAAVLRVFHTVLMRAVNHHDGKQHRRNGEDAPRVLTRHDGDKHEKHGCREKNPQEHSLQRGRGRDGFPNEVDNKFADKAHGGILSAGEGLLFDLFEAEDAEVEFIVSGIEGLIRPVFLARLKILEVLADGYTIRGFA